MEQDGAKVPEQKTCATCRFAATYRRKQIIDGTGFDDQMMFKDPEKVIAKDSDGNEYEREVENEIVYSCRAFAGSYAGKTIGLVPITCDAWAPPQTISPEKKAELDALEARYLERTKNRKDRERE